MQAILSNQIESLYHHLKERLFASGGPFTRRLIAVPSSIIQNYLMERLAEDPEIGIVMGVEFCSHSDAIARLSTLANLSMHIPTPLELSFALESLLDQYVCSPEHPLFHYLGEKTTSRYFKRRARLAKELAGHFYAYGLYGYGFMEIHSAHWQYELWNQLKKEAAYKGVDQHAYLSRPIGPIHQEIEVHFFALSYHPPLHHQFLERMGKEILITYYVLSPSCHFWSDLLTDKQVCRMQQRESAQTHSLLANWGHLGARFAKQLEESSMECLGDYHMVFCDAASMATEEVTFQEKQIPTLLDYLQADLLVMQERVEKKELMQDASFSVLIAPSVFREVAIVHDKILQMMDAESFLPSDVLVMAPDISIYSTAIQSVFGAYSHLLDYRIYDHSMTHPNDLVSALECLFKVAEGEWDASLMSQLLMHPCIAKQASFDSEDLLYIKKWLQREVLDGRQLLNHLHEELLTGEDFSMSQAELLGRWNAWMSAFDEKMQWIKENKCQTLAFWGHFLEQTMSAFVDLPEDGQGARLCAFIELLKKSCADLVVPWKTLVIYLMEYLNETKGILQETHVHAVRFCSLLPMRALPAKIVIIMGMSEENFPKKNIKHPQDLLEGTVYAPPSSGEYDLYIFLEAILSAREKIFFTLTSEDQANFALPLAQLLTYLDAGYSFAGQTITQAVVFQHPASSCDPFYFKEGCPHPSYSHLRYQLACPTLLKERPFQDLFSYSSLDDCIDHQEIELTVNELVRICKDPLAVFMKKTLGMAFSLEKENSIEDQLTLSALDLYASKKKRSCLTAQAALHLLVAKSKIPSGVFKSLAMQQVCESFDLYREKLKKWSAQPLELQTLHLGSHCLNAVEISLYPSELKNWNLGSAKASGFDLSLDSKSNSSTHLSIDHCNVVITGEIEGVLDERLFIDREANLKGFLLSWPLILIFSKIQKERNKQAEIIFLKDDRSYFPDGDKIEAALKALVRHALLVQKRMVPLLPEWIEAWEEGFDGVNKTIAPALTDHAPFFYNPTILWMKSRRLIDSVTPDQAQAWGEYVKNIFSNFSAMEKSQ